MTHVLMTADCVGGVWTYACELIGALAAERIDVTLATMGGALSPSQRRQAAALANLEVVESELALEWMQEPWRDVDAAGDWLLELAERVAPDVVQINGYTHAALPFAAPIVVVAHSCVWTWMRAVRHREPGAEWDEYRRRVTAGLAAADVVVGPTAAILRGVLDAYGVQSLAHVIPNGCAAEPWRPGAKAPIVLTAGRLWDEAKGLAELIACAPHVAWPIIVAGPTAPPGAAEPAPSPGIHALGMLARDELAPWTARASIYALPARYEPFGLSVLEAALAGCALVLGDIPTLRELWHDTAIYVPPGDPEALATALNRLIGDPMLRGKLSARSRARALGLTPARMAAAYRTVYDDVVARRQAVLA
jgi:glycosyltransferase involved in cell wall biosynthesis